MKTGPAPIPTATLRLRGSHLVNGRAKEPKTQPMRKFECRPWMSQAAKKKMKALSGRLRGTGILGLQDRDAMVVYCQAWAHYEEAAEWITKHGQMQPVKDKDGTVVDLKPWPHVRVIRDLLPILLRYQQEFGMTPSSRSRTSVIDQGDSGLNDIDDKEGFLRLG